VSRKLPIQVSANIKTSIARAVLKPGSGSIRINSVSIDNWGYPPYRDIAFTPVKLIGDRFNEVNVIVNVKGGGVCSQSRAIAVALSKGIFKWTRSKAIRTILIDYDPHILSGDPRRTEPKKFGGPSSRRRFQKSYR
jgi:small subunit ribosomal protein S9